MTSLTLCPPNFFFFFKKTAVRPRNLQALTCHQGRPPPSVVCLTLQPYYCVLLLPNTQGFSCCAIYHIPVCKGAPPPAEERRPSRGAWGPAGSPAPARPAEASLPSADTNLKLPRASLGAGLSGMGCRQGCVLVLLRPAPARGRMRAQRARSHTDAHLIQPFYCFLLWDPEYAGTWGTPAPRACCASRLLLP